MIRVKHVSKTYPNGTAALDQVDLEIDQNEFVFLVGTNGAGKSTLMRMLYRAEKPTQGEITIDDLNVVKLSSHKVPYLRRNIGVIFQDYKLLPKRTVFENIAFALQVIGHPRSAIHRQVQQVLEVVGLAHKADSMPHEISGGEQQKVCIARAIVNSPVILLADEPTGNLSPDASWEIIQLLGRIHSRKTTVLVATHDQNIVDSMRKRVVSMHAGRIIADRKLGNYQDAF